MVNNPFIASAVGIWSAEDIPHEATFSRFYARLANYQMLPRLKDVSRELVRRRYAIGDNGFGDRVALDSSTLKAWSNGARTKKADPQAGWSIKMGTQGIKEHTYGWKLHLLVDCETEFPLSANVTPGNVHDSQRATNLLREARFTYRKFLPKYVMADKGYSGAPLLKTIRTQFSSTPIIDINPGHRKLKAKHKELESSLAWKALYSQRVAVERVFSRLKGARALNNITVRGRWKVGAHCYLSVIAMQAALLSGLTFPSTPERRQTNRPRQLPLAYPETTRQEVRAA